MNRDAIIQIAKNIQPFNAVKYLRGMGWKELTEIKRKDIFLFTHPHNEMEQLIVPRNNDYGLYPRDILRAVDELQRIEQRDAESILTQLCRPEVDILRYRIQSSQAATGTLTLGHINKFIGSVVTSLKASVCDCVLPSRHHTRVGNRQVDCLLEQAQFGQTEYGSFIVKVIAPVQSSESLFAEGFRSGIVHLLKSSAKIVDVVKQGRIDDFIRETQDNPPFSDNLINSIADLQIWDDAMVELYADWSPLLSADNVPQKVSISRECFDEISRLGYQYAPKPEERKIEFFTGFVRELRGTPNETDKVAGLTTIYVTTREEESFPAEVNLTEEEYTDADKAHMSNLPVSFSGKLIRKSSRRREIVEINSFALCPQHKASGNTLSE